MEGRELPVGWERCLLGDVVDYGRTQKAEPADIPDHAWVLELEDIEKDSSKLLSRSTFAERKSKSTKNAFEKGAVLYGKLRPYLNKVLLADGPGFCSTEIIPLLAGEGIAAGYLFHWLKSPEFLEYTDEVSHGINMPRLGTEAGRKAPLVLAPLNEQRRIAAKLDTTLAAVEACRQRLDGVAAILKRFRRAVLAAATSGELTREWASGSLWKECSITDVCEVVRGASPRPAGDPRFFGGMGTIPWITVGELTKDSDKYLLSTSCFLTEAGMAKSRCIVPGTLLLTNSGVTLGVPKISMIEGCINDGSVALLGLEEPLKSYVYYVLRSKTQDLRSINQGAAQPNLNTSIVKAIRFMLPDCSKEQSEVVRRIEELFTLADQLEARLDAARKVVDRLTPALLSKAFRGELVPQDPSDEPASVLLERIRAARQAEAGAGKTSRRGRPKAAANPAPVDRNAAPVPSEPLPPDLLTQLLRECGALSERALLAVSELEPERFEQQLFRELERGTAREVQANGQVLLEAVG